MKTIIQLLEFAYSDLKEASIQDYKKSAERLLSHLLSCKKNDLYLRHQDYVDEKTVENFLKLLERRKNREPVEYIIGMVDFYGCEIEVNQGVLIPRVETELLVELVVKDIKSSGFEKKIIWDVCTGSGAIGIAIKKALPFCEVIISDISKKALDLAKKNIERNHVEISLKEGDLLTPFKDQKADYIICNPPYIKKGDLMGLQEEVRAFEPLLALDGGPSGLDFYRRFEKEVKNYLKPNGKLFFEIGCDQKEEINNIFSKNYFAKKRFIKDLAGHDRFFFLEIE